MNAASPHALRLARASEAQSGRSSTQRAARKALAQVRGKWATRAARRTSRASRGPRRRLVALPLRRRQVRRQLRQRPVDRHALPGGLRLTCRPPLLLRLLPLLLRLLLLLLRRLLLLLRRLSLRGLWQLAVASARARFPHVSRVPLALTAGRPLATGRVLVASRRLFRRRSTFRSDDWRL